MTRETPTGRLHQPSVVLARLALLPVAAVLAGLCASPLYAGAAPTTPAPVTATARSPLSVVFSRDTATLTWAAVPGASSYLVGRDGVDATGYGAWSTTDTATAHSRTFTALVPGRTYTLFVQAPGGARQSIQVTPGASAVAPITVVAGNGSATLTWAEVPGASSYIVGRDGVDATGYGAWSTTDPAAARSRTFNSLVNGRTYTLFVQAPGAPRQSIEVTPRTASTPTPTPKPTPTPTPTPTPAPVVPLKVVAGNGSATLTWSEVPGASSYTVGRDGVDSTGYGAWSTVDPATARTRTFESLVNGRTYTLFVQASGAARQSVQVVPVARATTPTPTLKPSPTPTPKPNPPVTPAPTPPVTSGKIPLIGKSGLPWNSLVMGHGLQPQTFETWRNRPVDGSLSFGTRYTWNDLAWLPTRRADDLVVWSIPTFPENIGGSNAKVAAGQYDAEIRALAVKMQAAGWNTNRTVIRLGWENNGNWYQWGQDRGGSDAFKAAFRRYVTQSRAAGLTNVKWDWNLNKGPQGYNANVSWATGYPGDDVVDVIGLDAYDSWKPSFTDADWNANMLNRNPGLQEVANFARERNKQMSLDEWGVVHDPSGGGDNPFYVRKMFEFLKANADILAWESTYDDDGAPATLNHKLSDGGNPKAAAQYRLPYPNGWGR